MKKLTFGEACKALENLGFEYVRTKGDHCKYKYKGEGKQVIVPGARSKQELSPNVTRNVIDAAGVTEEEFRKHVSKKGKGKSQPDSKHTAKGSLESEAVSSKNERGPENRKGKNNKKKNSHS